MRRSATLVAALLAGACMGPRPRVPEAATVTPPAAWRDGAGAADAVVAPDWWRSYDDPVLARLVEAALADNADVATAVSRIGEAQAQVRLVRGDLLPQVAANLDGAARMQTYSPLGQRVDLSGYVGGVQASWTLDLFGRLRNQTRAAQAQLLGTTAAADTVRLIVASETASDYIQLRLYDASLDIALRGLALRREELARRQRQAQVGYADQLAIDQATGEVQSLEEQIPDIRTSIRHYENALSVLLGRAPEAMPRGRMLAALAVPAVPATLPARMLRRRPDLFTAEQDVVAADRSLSSARAAFLPDLTLSGQVARLDATLLPSPITLYSFVGSVLAPIFQGGKLRAGEDIAASRRDQAAFAYRGKALAAFREVEDAMTQVANLADKERATTARAASADHTLALARHRYDEGYVAYFEVIDAERAALTAQFALVEVRAARLDATVALYAALGGGWQAPPPPVKR